ncbi:MAG: hypothetical protein JNL83_21715 [Myxococcales bacterium]|nr:hypothetical protein [Myxococcales bacterium]
MKTLSRVQRGLESLYRVETGVEVEDFVVGAELRDELVRERRPREQLLVIDEGGGEVSMALYICPGVLANLHANDPGRRLDDRNLGDFLLAVEGVSHFIYAICCAKAERRLSQLELELQAEVDKYTTCLLQADASHAASEMLRRRLFGDAEYEPDLDHDEQHRYRAANDNAQRYAAFLEEAFVARRKIPEMLAELRRFYRLPLAEKLATCARAA